MKYAIFGDIHSNIHALSAVYEDSVAQKVDAYACVGDIVGYNASPRECLDAIRQLDARCVRGNHDHYCSYNESLRDFHPLAAEVVDWTRSLLTADEREFLHDLKFSASVEGFTIVHSTLDTPEMWGYIFDPLEAESNFAYQSSAICFYGHTHVPLYFEKFRGVEVHPLNLLRLELGRKYFVNVGSVGQPRDGDPRASYAVYDTDIGRVQLRRIEYDIEAAQRGIIDAGLPRRLADRLAVGK